MSMTPRMSTGHVEKFDKQQINQAQNGNATLSKKAMKQQLLASSHKRKYSQSKQPVEHESSEDKDQEDAPGAPQQTTFRSRSKTISDTSGKTKLSVWLRAILVTFLDEISFTNDNFFCIQINLMKSNNIWDNIMI